MKQVELKGDCIWIEIPCKRNWLQKLIHRIKRSYWRGRECEYRTPIAAPSTPNLRADFAGAFLGIFIGLLIAMECWTGLLGVLLSLLFVWWTETW